ncbi:unnamed protein product, partial [Rotaria magnacalcarata]
MLLYSDSYTSYCTTSPSSLSSHSSPFSNDTSIRFPHKYRSNVTLPDHSLPIQSRPVSSSARNSSSYDSDIIRETILELDRIVEKDIKDLETECHRHSGSQPRTINSGHVHQQRSRSVDSRRHARPPPRPPTSSSSISSSSRTAEERRLYEHRMQTE